MLTCSVNHSYKPEQQAFDLGLMDKFPENVGVTSARPTGGANCAKADPAYGAGVAKALGIDFKPEMIAAE